MSGKVSARAKTSLRVVDGPERRWEGYDVKPKLAPKYGHPWTEDEVRYVILNAALPNEDVAADLDRSPGSVNAIRGIIRAVAGATSNAGRWVNETSARAQLARKVLDDLHFQSWSPEERRRYLVRGGGRRSDGSQKALLLRRGLKGQRPVRKTL